jgi:hypothetical protein
VRFSRRRQRERAEQAAAEDEARTAALWQVARWFSPGTLSLPPRPPWHGDDETRPYRGFRAGRARERPDRTGYDEPISPDRERWAEPRADDPTLDPIIGDSDDEPWTP